MEHCSSCFKEQGTINEKFQKALKDAQTLANTENKAVAVFIEGQGFNFAVFASQSATVAIIKPVQ